MVSFITLFFTTIINLILIYYFPKNKNLKYLLVFNLGFLLGQLLLILRNTIPDFFSIVVGNSFLVAGHICVYVASRGLLKLENRWRNRYFIPIGVVAIGLCVFTYVYYHTEMRIVIFSLFCTIYGVILAWIFLKYASGKLLLLHYLTSFFFLISAVMFFIRAITASIIDFPVSYLSINDLMIVMPYVYLVFISFWLCLLFALQIRVEQENNEKEMIQKKEQS